MKFVNATLASRRCHGDSSQVPYGRKGEKAAVSLPPPAPKPSPKAKMEELLKTLKPESKEVFKSKLLKASKVIPVSVVQKETEDILAILRDISAAPKL